MQRHTSGFLRATGLLTGLLMAHTLGGCAGSHRTFGSDAAFLKAHTDSTVVLGSDPHGPRVAVVADYQGRVMTSSPDGDGGVSCGFLNHELIASGELQPHINAFGGENRFWLGPEGGQFALFFPPGGQFNLDDWQTPPVIDSEPFKLMDSTSTLARFERSASLVNYSGTRFDLRINRDVELLDNSRIASILHGPVGSMKVVGYETRNRVTNTGANAWTKDTGLVSIWLLGMFNPGPHTTIVLPYRAGPESELGTYINDEYFGKVPPERLKRAKNVFFFRGDTQYRSKIGLPPARATPVAGSWDPDLGLLTIVQYESPGPAVTDYVNSMWEIQAKPFGGDVINSYNDGPTTPGGKALGGFYEIETSSPALALKPGETGSHTSRTIHLEGERTALDAVARRVLGVGLDEIEAAFGR